MILQLLKHHLLSISAFHTHLIEFYVHRQRQAQFFAEILVHVPFVDFAITLQAGFGNFQKAFYSPASYLKSISQTTNLPADMVFLGS